MKKNFIFPRGVRFPNSEEIPNGDDKGNILNKYKNVIIEVGYTIRQTDNPNYKCYTEINVSEPDIWNIFENLSKTLLPELSAPILGFKDQEKDELYYGPYINRDKILTILSEYQYELANDGFIQFGMIHQANRVTEEIFVHPSKHFTLWTNQEAIFNNLMEKNNIPKYEQLKFIDEYPRVTLNAYEGMKIDHNEVVEKLKNNFTLLE